MLSASLEKKKQILNYLPLKQKKASFLVELSQELVKLDDPENVFNFLLSAVEQLFPGFDFISLFEFDRKIHQLKLILSRKKKDIPIKEKKGSGIEKWIMRQNSSILIGDIRKDFRFDSSRVEGFIQRDSLSFLAGPLSVGENLFGAIRVESGKENFFSYEDLRLLGNICDLGAVILERARLLRQVEELAVTDSLTSLSLRNYLEDKIKIEITRAKNTNSQVSLLMFDIDNFKEINDNHGHVVGDLVLKKIAKNLKKMEANPDFTACRYGGEEFMLLLADTGKDEALKIAESLREKISDSVVVYRRNKVQFTVSGGLVTYPENEGSFGDLIGMVDKLMYKAKKEGKNKICFLS